MKQGTKAIWFTMLVLFLGILAYCGIYLYRSFNAEETVTTVYTYTAEDRIEVTGYLVRSETVIGGASSELMEVVLDEGEKVAKGGTVANIYSSQEAASRQKEMDSIISQLERLENLDSGSSYSSDSKALDESIVNAIIRLREDLATDSGRDLSGDSDTLQDLVFEREYLYSGTGNLAEDISNLASQLSKLQSASTGGSQKVTASLSGIYSSTVDGYENVLTPDSLTDLTPSVLASWEGTQETVDDKSTIGKLIDSQTWYYATTMDEEDAQRMGSTVTLRFTSDFTDEITMTVKSISQAEDGQVAVVFSTNKYLTQTTQLRYQSADLVYDSTTGLRVPLSAIQVDETGQQGVYVITGTQHEWKPVNVIYRDDEFCLVESTEEGKATALHSGDTVVVKGKNIEDGKVID
jgi:putative membrane fusion protein